MSILIIVLTTITAYLIGGMLSAPYLMRTIYLESLAEQAVEEADYQRKLADWKAKPAGRIEPFRYTARTEHSCRHNARLDGAWQSLIWPVSLAFIAAGNRAFRGEIAAEQATKNARIIADYDRLLEERFDQEMAAPSPKLGRRLLQRISR